MRKKLIGFILVLTITTLSCGLFGSIPDLLEVSPSPVPTGTMNLSPAKPEDGTNPDEPLVITGTIPFTSPFFLDSASQGFVLLEDQTGFVKRDDEYVFPLNSQVIGPIYQIDDSNFGFSLSLPLVPQAAMNDVDHDGQEEAGVMVFQIAFWGNTWGGPFLEKRDGTGWSGGYTSATVDPERDYEINGGVLLIWSPDDQQSFPTGFGEDKLLFTDDDPTTSVPAGYSLVNLGQEPFQIYKETNPELVLNEGSGEVKDFSDMSYAEAFDALFERVSIEYPFTEEKHINWGELYAKYAPMVSEAKNQSDFNLVIQSFVLDIPDAHVGMDIDVSYFYQEYGGSFGMVLAELSNGSVIVSDIIAGLPADEAGIVPGAEILKWEGLDPGKAVSDIEPYFGPFSTEQHKHLYQLIFLPRVPTGTEVTLEIQNPGDSVKTITMEAEQEIESLYAAIPSWNVDVLNLPIEGEVLEEYNIGYIRIDTFSDDYALMAATWDRFINTLIDQGITGLIIDLRINGGGNSNLANDFANYFFDDEFDVYQRSYYNSLTEEWEYSDYPTRIEPGPSYYRGEVVLLVSPYCVSACEGFAGLLTQDGRAQAVGNYPTAGAFGEVGQGQYLMPGEISMQFPTGRAETMDGELYLEGVGIIPDLIVPVTLESALGERDTLMEAAIDLLTE
ncbi:MAG: hypothetical protein JXA19_04220 [Anaerolineales bacterium]|nr:hypothetical protein [Anaerolineales bacterium]